MPSCIQSGLNTCAKVLKNQGFPLKAQLDWTFKLFDPLKLHEVATGFYRHYKT